MGIVPDIVVDSAPAQESKAEERKRSGIREENLPGHLQNQQTTPAQEPEQGNKDSLVPSTGPTGDDTIDKDQQLKRALDLLKSWDVFKQVVQKQGT
jgi:carboxyl-terminal processing protease